ncbi:MAG TPA: serine/threonine-protein kinase [Gemmatimonadales bacterium]|nr:serine/threonine-protein kinase [Gemmatimonadales bacterium]
MPSLLERLRSALAGRYAVERELGSGGMGVVLLARDLQLDRLVAIKVLRPELATAVATERFAREAKLLARLSHPNIVPVHEAGVADGVPYYVMDYVEGDTLETALHAGPLDPEAVRALGSAMLDALEAAHLRGIVHRDIKPANIFFVGERPRLADFGVARADAEDSALTASDALIGTPAYMAPEQLTGGPVSARTDLYALGLVLYEACTGERWQPATPPEKGDWSGVPRRLARPLERALAVAPAERWPDAAAFRAALTARRDRGSLVASAAAAALAGAALLVWWRPDSAAGAPPAGGDLAVLPFSDTAGGGAFGRRLARHVANRLEWFPAWRLAPVAETFAWWDSTPPARREGRLPQGVRARAYAEGELARDGGTELLRLTIRDSTGRLVQALSVPGRETDLLGWSAAAADSIVQRLFPAQVDQFRELTARGSANVQAYNELLAGQEAFRRDAWAEAQARFERALELDPAFAEAAWELTLVRRWRERAYAADLRALHERYGAALPPLQARLARAQLEPDLGARFALLEDAVQRYPRRTEAMLLYADELFHRGPLAGVPLDSALRVMDEVVRREPYSTALAHTALGHVRLGNREAASRALAALDRVGGEAEEAARLRRFVHLVYDHRFVPWRARIKVAMLRWTADSATLDGIERYARWGSIFDVPVGQRAFGRILVGSGGPARRRGSGHEARGLALVLQGRPRAALAELDAAALLFASPEAELERWEWRALAPALGLGGMPDATRDSAVARLSDLARGPLGVRAAGALATAAYARGDTAAAHRWHSRLRADGGALAGALAPLADALRDAAGGRLDSALARTESLLRAGADGLAREPFARAVLYLRRGEWLDRTGDAAGAAAAWLWSDASDVEGWPVGEAQAGEVDAALSAVARLRRATLALGRGNTELGCRLVGRVRELWASAEPGYAPRTVADSLGRTCPA